MSSLSRRTFLRQAGRLAALGTAAPLGLSLAAVAASANAASLADYRALVCVFLYGGNDSYNTLIPCDTATYGRYLTARPALAQTHDSVLPYMLSPSRPWPHGQAYGLHPRLQALHSVHERGELAWAMRLGTLRAPVTKADYLAQRNLPPKLMSHNDQFYLWQALAAEGASNGWGGRIGDMLMDAADQSNSLFTAMSIDNNAVFSSGARAQEFTVTSEGPITLQGIPGVTGSAEAMFNALTGHQTHLMTRELSRRTQAAEWGGLQLSTALEGIGPFDLPATGLGLQLQMVARIMAARNRLGVKRQTFFVSMSGFDLHNGLAALHGDLLQELGDALAAFQWVLNQQGLGGQVLTFTASDFGRALTANGDGVDHGWAGHHLVMGQAVQPRQWVGDVPLYVLGAEDDIGQGRMLPNIAVDQLGATLATWMGVPASDLPIIFPNLGAFDRPTLDLLR